MTLRLVICAILAVAVYGTADCQSLANITYDISVTLDDESHTLNGALRLNLTNETGDELRKLMFHLYPNAYSGTGTAFAKQHLALGYKDFQLSKEEEKGAISGLEFTRDGEKQRFLTDPENPDIGTLRLKEPLQPGESVVLETPFVVQIPESFSRLGHVAQSYQVTQWYPKLAMYDADGWHPMPYLDQGEFYSEFATYNVSITLPANYIVAATGQLMTVSEQLFLDSLAAARNEATYTFPQSALEAKTIEYAASHVHDFAWFADKRFAVRKADTWIDEREVQCWVFFTAVNAEKWEKATSYIERSLHFYSELVGPYPFQAMTAVESPLSSGGGMEYPMITLIGDEDSDMALDRVITHEVGHNWFYAVLASNERAYPWLDEGVNSYYEQRYMREHYGGLYDDFLPHFGKREAEISDPQLLMSDYSVRGKLQCPVTDPALTTSDNYLLGAYLKGAYALEMIESAMGRDAFDSAMRSYYESWKFKHPGPEALYATLEQACRCDLDWFEDLMSSVELMDYRLDSYDPASSQVHITNRGSVKAPVQLVSMRGDSLLAEMWISGFSSDTIVEFNPGAGERITLYDPQFTLDRTPGDNIIWVADGKTSRKKLKVTMLSGVPDPRYRLINVVPMIGANLYDKFLAGINISNLYWPASKFQYSLTPMFSTGAGSVAGLGNVQYSLYPGTAVSRVTFGLDIKSFHYNSDDHYDFEDRYVRWSPSVELELGPATPLDFNRHFLSYRFVSVDQFYGRGINFDDRTWEREHRSYYVNDLRYTLRNDRAVSPMTMSLGMQQGKGFVRLSAEYNQKVAFRKGNKGFYARGFAGWLPHYDDPDAVALFFFNGISSQGFYSKDFMYEELLFGRSDQSGLFSQQVFLKDAQLKTLYNGGISESWMASVGLASDIPLPVPFQFYIDLVLFPDPFEDDVRLSYSAGVSIVLVKDAMAIYIPLLESSDIRESLVYEERNFLERISFVFDLNKLNPRKYMDDFLD